MAWLTIMTMRSSEMGDSLARGSVERRILMASKKGTLYAEDMIVVLVMVWLVEEADGDCCLLEGLKAEEIFPRKGISEYSENRSEFLSVD